MHARREKMINAKMIAETDEEGSDVVSKRIEGCSIAAKLVIIAAKRAAFIMSI
jgi:hypothetical protein